MMKISGEYTMIYHQEQTGGHSSGAKGIIKPSQHFAHVVDCIMIRWNANEPLKLS